MKATRVGLPRQQDQMDGDVPQPGKKRTCIKWDEDNLSLNEDIKAELDCQKIDEPDTPFVRSPLREDDDSDDEGQKASDLLEMTSEAKAKIEAIATSRGQAIVTSGTPGRTEHENTNGAIFADRPPVTPAGGARFAVPEPRATVPTEDGARRMSDTDTFGSRASSDRDIARRGSNTGWTTEEEEEEQLKQARQLSDGYRRMSNGEPCDLPSLSPSDLPFLMKQTSFDEKRKQHYDLRDALRRGKELLEAEEDEEDEDEELNAQNAS